MYEAREHEGLDKFDHALSKTITEFDTRLQSSKDLT
jgi:hypothetical protein